jgi:hypothetical protein
VLTLDHLEAGGTRDRMPNDWECMPLAVVAAFVPREGAHELVLSP